MTSKNYQDRIADLHKHIDEFYAEEPQGGAVLLVRFDKAGTSVWRMFSPGTREIFVATLQSVLRDEAILAEAHAGGRPLQ